MKKNYFLTLLLTFISAVSFGQVLAADDFSYPDGSLVPNGGWAREGGTAGDFQVTAGQAVVQHGTPSEDVKLAFTAVSGDVYVGFDFSVDDLGAVYSGTDNEYFTHLDFKARMDIVPGSSGGDFSVGISSASATAEATWATDLTFGTTYRAIIKFDQDTGTAQLWIDPATSSDTSISGTDSGAFSVDEFELRQSDSSENETVRVYNLMIGQNFNDFLVFAAQTDPELTITAPTNNQVFNPGTTTVDVTIDVQNFVVDQTPANGGSGDGHIHWTIDSGSGAQSQPMKYDTNAESISVTDGGTYTVYMELVDNSHQPINPAVNATVTFSVASISQVADIAALRSGTQEEFFEITGGVVVTYVTGNSRNQIYIQDASGGMLIDDQPGTITTTYNVGDEITGLKGELDSFGGFLQFKPTEDPGAATATGQSYTTTNVSMADYIADVAKSVELREYASEWITIDDATFDDADGTATFDSTTERNYGITEGANNMVMRLQFDGTDIEGSVIPSSSANITGIAGGFNSTAQIYPIDLASILLSVESFNEIQGFGAFPNPVKNKQLTISSSSTDAKEVVLYSVLGRKVLSQDFSGNKKTIDLSNVNSGIYILKVTENGKTSTKKLVVE